MPSLPLVARTRRRRRRRPLLFASLLAHGLVLTLILLLLHQRPAPEESGREQSVAMVFEPTPTPSLPARPGVPELTRPGGLPQPITPPVPEAPPIPEPPLPPAVATAAQPPQPTASPPPAAPAPASPPQEEVNLQPPPAPPAPALPDLPPVPVPAAPSAEATPQSTPLLPDQDLAGTLPIPPPVPAETPRPAQPQREAALSPPLLRPPPTHREARPETARPRASRPAPPRNGFPAPMDFSFAPPTRSAPQSVARSMLQPPAPTDSEPGFGSRTAAGMLETFARAREGDPGPDFMASLKSWWLAHRFYPPQAIDAGEDGDVQLSLIVDRQGRVTEVQLETRSGSMWLDLAGQSTWRNARLLPIPDSMGRDHLTIDLTLHYVLMRR